MKNRSENNLGIRKIGESVWEDLRQDKVGFIFLVTSLCLLITIFVENWVCFLQNVSDDSAGDFLYMYKVWETKDPFTPTYANSNELFFSRPWFFFVLFYSINHSIILSSKLTLVAATACLVASAVYFFRKMGWKWPAVFLAFTIFFGLVPRETIASAFRYIAFYSTFYSGMLISFGILIDVIDGKKLSAVKYILLLGFALYFGLCGERMLLCMYLPIFAAELLSYINSKVKGGPLFQNSPRLIAVSGLMLLSDAVGFVVYKVILTPHMHYEGEINFFLESEGNIWNGICLEIRTFLQGLHIYFKGTPAFSLDSFFTLFMIGIGIVLIYGVYRLIKMQFFSAGEKRILWYLCVMGGVLFLAAITTTLTLAGRYWMILPVLLAVIFAVLYRFFLSRTDLKVLRAGFCGLALVGVLLSANEFYFHQFTGETPNMLLTQHLKENGVNRIAGNYWDVSNIILLSDNTIDGMTVTYDDNLQPSDWLFDRTRFKNDDEPVTFVLNPEHKKAWEESEKRSYLLSCADRTEEFLSFSLYYFDHNPLAFDLTKYGEEAKFNFLSLSYGGEASLDAGRIILDKNGSQYGPYCSLKAGDYDVVVRGENLTAGSLGASSSTQALQMENLQISDNEAAYSIHLEEDAVGVELWSFNGSDQPVIIDEITVTPVGGVRPIWE